MSRPGGEPRGAERGRQGNGGRTDAALHVAATDGATQKTSTGRTDAALQVAATGGDSRAVSARSGPSQAGARKLFPASFGIELEYPIVEITSLNIRPGAELLLRGGAHNGVPTQSPAAAGKSTESPAADDDAPDGRTGAAGRAPTTSRSSSASERSLPPLALSNELVTHVIEIKNPEPVADPATLLPHFLTALKLVRRELAPHGLDLLPVAAHPWMDPLSETRLWEHEQTEIYKAYDRIFGTAGHGWSNLQSCHLNIGFRNSREFRHLHAALRALLPLMPGLSAASPYLDGAFAGAMDARLIHYAKNQQRIPVLSGSIVPEVLRSPLAYSLQLFPRIRRALAPFDREGILDPEWVNSRGFIPKFSRQSMEVRVLDLQIHPEHDFVICLHIVNLVSLLCAAFASDKTLLARAEALPQDGLCAVYNDAVQAGSTAKLSGPLAAFLRETGLANMLSATLRDFWSSRFEAFPAPAQNGSQSGRFTRNYKNKGTAAEQLYARLGAAPSRTQLQAVYNEFLTILDK